MKNLKIKVFKGSESSPETTVTIPTRVLKVAAHLIPRAATAALAEQGIDVDEIVKLATSPDVEGTLVEVEDHKKNERVVIVLG